VINGTNKKTVGNSPSTNEKVTFGSAGDFKSTDFGLTTIAGFESAAGFSIGGNFEMVLTNILQKSTANAAKTGVFYVSIGKRF
jgi:hypothetical protein